MLEVLRMSQGQMAAIIKRRDAGVGHVVTPQGASLHGYLAYEIISMLCIALVSLLFGIRCRHLRLRSLRQFNPSRLLVLTNYILTFLYIFILHILQGGIGLTSPNLCSSSIYACLTLYFANKSCIYLFLVERAHVVRIAQQRRGRFRDWVWVSGMCVNVIGIAVILTTAFVGTKMPVVRGVCHVVFPRVTVGVALAFDVFINLGLTVIFVIALLPVLRFSRRLHKTNAVATKAVRQATSSTTRINTMDMDMDTEADVGKSAAVVVSNDCENQDNPLPRIWKSCRDAVLKLQSPVSRLDLLFRKTIIGTCLVLVPTIANLAILTADHGDEPAWFCLTVCTLDVTAQVCVVFWLTVDPLEAEQEQVSIHASRHMSGQQTSSTPKDRATEHRGRDVDDIESLEE